MKRLRDVGASAFDVYYAHSDFYYYFDLCLILYSIILLSLYLLLHFESTATVIRDHYFA